MTWPVSVLAAMSTAFADKLSEPRKKLERNIRSPQGWREQFSAARV